MAVFGMGLGRDQWTWPGFACEKEPGASGSPLLVNGLFLFYLCLYLLVDIFFDCESFNYNVQQKRNYEIYIAGFFLRGFAPD
jgi:hypothetical protein